MSLIKDQYKKVAEKLLNASKTGTGGVSVRAGYDLGTPPTVINPSSSFMFFAGIAVVLFLIFKRK